MNRWLRSGDERMIQGPSRAILNVLMLFVFAYAIWSIFTTELQPYTRNVGFAAMMLACLFFVKSPAKGVGSQRIGWYDWVIIAVTLYIGAFVFFNEAHYVGRFPIVDPLTTHEWVIGLLLILIALEATRRSLGAAFTGLILLLVAYFFFGHLVPGSFSHNKLTLTEFIDYMSFTMDGVFGSIASVAATYVFVFVLFGAFLDKSGAGDFFIEAANAIAGRQRGGPAKVAVLSSGLFGTISGSPVSDVVTTGSFTIPMMRKAGYPPAFAGAVEAVASSGGSIMPPVMGSAALLMTEIAGVPLSQVIIAAIVPAVLYYFSVYMQVHFRSVRMNLRPGRADMPGIVKVMLTKGYYVIPFALLVYLLVKGYTPQYAAIWSMVLIIVLSWIRKETRMGIVGIYEAVIAGVGRVVPLMSVVAGAGLLIGCMNVTGLGGKLMSLISGLTGDYVIVALLITALICIILGMGMPTAAAYVLTAVIAAPALIQLGVPVVQTHFFIVYFTVLSAITPPICVAAYAASAIAQADPIDIGWKAVKLGIAAYIVPFLFVFEPALNFDGPLSATITAGISALIGLTVLGSVIEGVLLRKYTLLERGLMFIAAALTIIPGILTDAAGYIIILAVLLVQIFVKPKSMQVEASA